MIITFHHMKNTFTRSWRRVIPAVLLGCSLFSCQDLLEVEPENALDASKFYQNKFDADAAVIGIYGEFMNLAQRHVVLNELRADLMDVTANADNDLVELSRHRVSMGNPYADPKPYYKVILLCNDALSNFDRMLAENKIDNTEYIQRYADIATLRSWLYLQLVTHYGEVPYITEPFVRLADVRNLDRFPRLGIEAMVKELIKVMEALPYMELYTTTNSLAAPIDNYATLKFFIHKKQFLGDLYLWDGRYLDAAKMYKDVMETGGPGNYDMYRIGWSFPTDTDLAVGYIRFKDDDYFSLVDSETDGWRSIFDRPVDTWFNHEWIWYLPFDTRFAPKNPFVDLFSNQGGRYLVKPSERAMSLWNSQVQNNGIPYDARRVFTVHNILGQPVIKKYIYDYNPAVPLETSGKWFLSRAANLHLRYAEAANRDNKRKLALAMLNQGISATYDNPDVSDERIDKQTFYPFPYDFEARNSNTPYFFRDTYHKHVGIRGRAYVQAKPVPAGITPQDSTSLIEDHLVEEAALELAYEGHRWNDLVRVAVRRNDPAFLADKIRDKLARANDPRASEVHALLMNRENWFLPFKWD